MGTHAQRTAGIIDTTQLRKLYRTNESSGIGDKGYTFGETMILEELPRGYIPCDGRKSFEASFFSGGDDDDNFTGFIYSIQAIGERGGPIKPAPQGVAADRNPQDYDARTLYLARRICQLVMVAGQQLGVDGHVVGGSERFIDTITISNSDGATWLAAVYGGTITKQDVTNGVATIGLRDIGNSQGLWFPVGPISASEGRDINVLVNSGS